VYPRQRTRIQSDCLSFATSDDDETKLNLTSTSLDVGNNRIVLEQTRTIEDTFNFVGNATVNTNGARFVFEGKTSDFGDRLAVAQQLNGSSAQRDSQASALFNSLLSTRPFMNLNYVELNVTGADMDGNLFSFFDLLIYSGRFNITQSMIRLNGTLESHMLSQVNGSLRNVQRVSVQSNSTSTLIEITADGANQLQFQGWNHTISSDLRLRGGVYAYSGQSVELNDCSELEGSSSLSPLVLTAIICGFAVLIGVGIGFLYKKKPKKTKVLPQVNYSNPYAVTSKDGQPYPQIAANPPPRPAHNIHNATAESLRRSDQFLARYPPGSPQALEAARLTANIPSAMAASAIGITMMEPRRFMDFPFYEPQPAVFISEMEPTHGVQRVTISTVQDCSIQTNIPLLPNRTGKHLTGNGLVDECYYQVKILRKPNPDTTIGIGYATCPYPPFRLPGWDPQSIGYHSDDGAVFLNDVDFGSPCGRALRVGDTLGIGYRVQPLALGYHFTFYFTINGQLLPKEFAATDFHPSMVYPTIGSDGEVEVELSFGNIQESFFPVQ
jgi:hypothetical protein